MRQRFPALLLLLLAVSLAPPAVQAQNTMFTPAQARRIKENAYSKSKNLTPQEAQDIYDYARILRKAGQGHEARALLKILTKTEFTNALTYCQIAQTYYEDSGFAGSSKDARLNLQKALQIDPDCSKAHVALAELELVEGRNGEALKNARKAVACKKLDDDAYLMLATVLATNKQYKEGLSYLEKSEKAGMVGGQMFRVKAGCLENLGRLDEAVKAYRQSFAIQPKDWTQFQIITCLELQKKYVEAISEVDKAIKRNPQDGEAFRMRAKLKLKINDKKGALADMNQSIDLEPTVKGYKERANMHRQMGHEDLARKDLAAADRLMNSPF